MAAAIGISERDGQRPWLVTFTLSRVADGTRVRLVHAGFVLPNNETAYKNMSDGWKKIVRRLDAIAAERDQ
jgi:uncharacterized protein YndB with AHSA1/START domain